jgi:signal transduction histidine kinase
MQLSLGDGIGAVKPSNQVQSDAATRVEDYVRESNLVWVTDALRERRDEILRRWLDAAAAQPFHRGHPDHAVADHIPRLFDALLTYLQRATPRAVDPSAPIDDTAIQEAGQGHALARIDQGLQPADVLVEFRLLRQELWRALRLEVPEGAPTSDVVAAELLLNDGLDGAAALALSALTARLEQVREEFLATTVHDVRQPITRVSGFAQLAERLLASPSPELPRVQDAVHQIREGVDEMRRLLDTLVDTSGIALGALVLHPTPTDLVALVQEVVAHADPEMAKRVRLEMPVKAPAAGQWDAGRLAQVLTNLLSNAAKYSPPESPITVAVESQADRIVLSVSDEGMGIPAEDLPRVFQRYARGHNAVAEDIEGLGLGLYLCRGIVAAHGGRIWATSPGVGRGATIVVQLALHAPEPDA